MSGWHRWLRSMQEGTAELPPFVARFGLPPLERFEAGRARFSWPLDADMLHEGRSVFGGFLAALADYAMGIAAMTVLEDGESFSTCDLQVSYFRPVKGTRLDVDARVSHRGRRILHTEAVFLRDDGTAAVRTRAVQAVSRPGDEERASDHEVRPPGPAAP